MRPAILRGLPPGSTLVLVNGKRRHRAAVITFLGNGVADGSQGPDIFTIPAIALKRVEVLRDGAAAQYGSDAIAGVINFELKDDAEGGSVEARWGWRTTVSPSGHAVILAFGFEHRQEEFKVSPGGMNSWYIDDDEGRASIGLAAQGFGIGSNGFTGFSPRISGTWSRNSYAGYVDVEAELTEKIVLGAAGRYEDHKGVGDTWDFKISARAQITDALALRGAVSTGFRAPTVGQANVQNVTTAFTGGMLADEATLPPTHSASALVGGKSLTLEESTNFTVGAVFNMGDLDVTVDYFNINVADRIARSSAKTLTDADRQTLLAQDVEDALSFTSVRFYVNDFETTTQGIDVIATYPMEMFGGQTNFSFAGNWTETKVDKRNPDLINDKRVMQLEKNNPEFRFTTTLNHTRGPWNLLLRGRFYDGFVEFTTDNASALLNAGSRWLMDAEIGYSLNDNITLVAGAENLTDTTPTNQKHNVGYPGEVSGMKYAETSPYGFNGGFYYFRAIWDF